MALEAVGARRDLLEVAERLRAGRADHQRDDVRRPRTWPHSSRAVRSITSGAANVVSTGFAAR